LTVDFLSGKQTLLEKENAFREAFLARLSQKLAVPSAQWPTVRCWIESALNKIFRQVRDELATEGVKSDLSHSSLLEWLCRLRLASSIPIQGETIYLLEIGASGESEISPLELLMAGKPSGIICYFSAVAYHGLTTQIVEHHHVAELQPQASGAQREHSEIGVAVQPERPTPSTTRVPRGLGTLIFGFQGVSFYSTRRSSRLIPGIQTRGYGPRAQIRITTLEQTLLDSLSKPFHCGGPAVVFEAWQEGVASRRIDEERLVMYLRSMNYPSTTRRVAVMLELVGGTPGTELRHFLQASQKAIDRQSPHACISLLPGVDYQNLNESWLVSTP
jgi:predicted transcriptional regulator of viral defense system